jgi:hypothetical protein
MEKSLKNIVRKILLITIWVVYLVMCHFVMRMYTADTYFKKSQNLIGTGEKKLVLKDATKAISLNPYEPNYYRGRAKILIVRYLPYSDKTSELKLQILADLKKAYTLNPTNLVTIRNSIPLYYFLAVKDLSLTSGPQNLDEEFVNYTKDFFATTKDTYWNDAGVIASLAKYEKKLGLDTEYEKSVERIRILRPDLLEWNESFR